MFKNFLGEFNYEVKALDPKPGNLEAPTIEKYRVTRFIDLVVDVFHDFVHLRHIGS